MPDLSELKKTLRPGHQAAQTSKPKSPDTRLSIPMDQDLLDFITEQAEANLRTPARQAQFMLAATVSTMAKADFKEKIRRKSNGPT